MASPHFPAFGGRYRDRGLPRPAGGPAYRAPVGLAAVGRRGGGDDRQPGRQRRGGRRGRGRRVVAGWPAFALLVAVKLLSQLLEPRPDGDRPVPTHHRPPPAGTAGDDLAVHDGNGAPDYTVIGAPRPAGIVPPPSPGTGTSTARGRGRD